MPISTAIMKPSFKPPPITANTCIISAPTIFTPKHSRLPLSTPSKPINLHLSCSHASILLPSLTLALRKDHLSSTLVSFVAQTSDCPPQTEKDDPFLEAEQELGLGLGFDDSQVQEPITWENDEYEEDAVEEEPRQDSYQPSSGLKLFVGNLPYDFDGEKLAGIFSQAGVVEVAEVINNRDTGLSRGFGFVTMSTVEETEGAIEMFHEYNLNGRLLTVNKAAPIGTRPARAPRISDPGFRIYVGNLPWSMDDARLEQIFSEHGKVVFARVVRDRENDRSRGFAFVTMSTESALNDAVAALDGQILEGRKIKVNKAEERKRRDLF